MLFYLACGVTGLFCLIALGLGPIFFTVVAVALAVATFRVRHERWWGLPAAGAGAAFAGAVLLGSGWRYVLAAFLTGFAVLSAARIAGRNLDRRARTARR